MNDNKLSQLVTAAVLLDRQIALLEGQLKEMKASIVAEASSRDEDRVPTDGGGSSIAFDGTDGCIARVSFPAPTLKSKIDGEGKAFDKIKAAVGSALSRLFVPSVVYRPVENFREEAAAVLGATDARKLVKLCESASSPRVSFETKLDKAA